MKRETIYDQIRRRLGECEGLHNRIARESGVAQSTVSRIHQGEVSPTLRNAQALLDWFEQYDQLVKPRRTGGRRPSAMRVADAQRIRGSRRAAATSAL